jgi:protein-serine/threonine kinase
VREGNQARAINDVVNALKPSQSSRFEGPGPLRVVNGMSTLTSTTSTTAALENVPISAAEIFLGRPGNSTIRWGGGLQAHPELREHEDDPSLDLRDVPIIAFPKKPITPSLATLEKAVSARIYFENLYFPLLRHPPSREQRRLAMENEMMQMQLSESQKERLRGRWLQNETDYLRDCRRKVDVSAFIKLKTIGHGRLKTISSVTSS